MKNIYIVSIAFIVLIYSCNQPNYKKDAITYNNKGSQFFLKNERDSALHYFTLATESDPKYQTAIQNKANTLIALEQYDKSVSVIEDLIKLNPYPEAFTVKGILLDKMNKPNDAQLVYEEGLKLFEERLLKISEDRKSEVMLGIGQLYYLKEDTTKAKSILNEHKIKGKDLGLADTMLNNLDNKMKFIDYVLKKMG